MTTRSLFRFMPHALSQHTKSLWRLTLGFGALAMLLTLVPLTTPVAHAAFPGTNGKIVFDRTVNGNSEIFVMNADGTGVTQLTNNSAIDQYPRWSADGTKIVFNSNRDGDHEIFVMNADGTGVTQLTANTALDALPAWSPDGSKIVFYSNRDGNDEIYTMNADGTAQTNRTNNSAGDVYASYSPDGTKIVFQTLRNGNAQIYTMNADGTSQTNISNNSYNEGGANWSPDGAKIAFHSDRVGNPNYEIYTMNYDGTGVSAALTSAAGQDINPAWSPDGTKIVFRSVRDGNQEMYVMNNDGTGQTNRTNSAENEAQADWQPLMNISFNPTTRFVQNGSNTTVNIDFNSATNLYGYQFQVSYDSSKVSASGVFIDTWFDTTTDANVPPTWNADCSAGVCKFAATKVSPATALTGSGTVAQITFTGTATGSSALTFTSDVWSDPDATSMTHTKNTASITVYDTATINGTVNLQGRATPLDATGTVTLTDPSANFPPTVVNFGAANGNFSTTVPALAGGTNYDIVGAHSLYLGNKYTGLAVTPGGTFSPSPATTKLFGGDANNDGSIGLGDLTCIGGAFGGAPVVCGTTGSSDINADSTTNILDLVLTGGNYGKNGTQTW